VQRFGVSEEEQGMTDLPVDGGYQRVAQPKAKARQGKAEA
jgi:hypothetical protein